jgi:hypothetical protein
MKTSPQEERAKNWWFPETILTMQSFAEENPSLVDGWKKDSEDSANVLGTVK